MPGLRYILGISAYYHDAAAALLRDGQIVAAAQEERFTRKKNDPDFPRHAVQSCLEQGGITTEQLAAVAFYDKPILKFTRMLESYLAVAPAGWLRRSSWKRLSKLTNWTPSSAVLSPSLWRLQYSLR